MKIIKSRKRSYEIKLKLPNEPLNEFFSPGTVKNFPSDDSDECSSDFCIPEKNELEVGVKPCFCDEFCCSSDTKIHEQR